MKTNDKNTCYVKNNLRKDNFIKFENNFNNRITFFIMDTHFIKQGNKLEEM